MLSIEGKGLKLIDVPGVGESGDRDNEYEDLYERLLPELDLVFWVFKADDRAGSSDEKFYKRLIRPYVNAGKPFLAVINQIDKIEPFREWDINERNPGPKPLKNIDAKRSHISSFFDIPLQKVIPVSANEKYGLVNLVDSIIHELPNEQKFIILEKIKKAEEINIAKAQAEAEKAQAEALKARSEAEKAQAEAERIKLGNELERIEIREARARASRAQLEAERVQAQANNARTTYERRQAETIISPTARTEAERGWWNTTINVVGKVVDVAVEVIAEGATYVGGKIVKAAGWLKNKLGL